MFPGFRGDDIDLSHVECNLQRVMNKGEGEHKSKFAIAYARVAIGELSPSAVAQQLESIRNYAGLHDLEIVGEYTDVGENEKQG